MYRRDSGCVRGKHVRVCAAIEVLNDGIGPDLHGAVPNALTAQMVLEDVSTDS